LLIVVIFSFAYTYFSDRFCHTNFEKLNAEVGRLLHLGVAEKTHATYQAGWCKFLEFCEEFDFQADLPVSITILCSFIAFLSLGSLAKSSIVTYVAGLGFKHKMSGFQDPGKCFIIKMMLDGIRRDKGASHDLRLPITIDRLEKIIGCLSNVCASHFEAGLFRAVFSLMFFGFLRIGEVGATSKSVLQTTLLRRVDVCFQVVEGERVVVINFRASKNNQFGKAQVVVLRGHPNKMLCPVSSLQAYLDLAQETEVLFTHFDSSPVTKYQLSRLLEKAVAFCQFPSQRFFKSHSFRIGAATTARQMGLTDVEIQQMGRWRSGAFKKYIRLPQVLSQT
jgi:hypothetical protein